MGDSILKTPVKLLAPAIIMICIIGAFSESSSMFSVYCALAFSVVAYFLDKLKFPMAPFLLSYILVSVMENNLWTTYAMTYGNFALVFRRPMFWVLLVIAVLSFLSPLFAPLMKKLRGGKAEH